jgi:adenosine deaminase
MVERDLSRAWLWLLLWCIRVYQDKDCGPKRRIAIFLLLGTLMRVRQDVLVEGYGLNRFLKASNNRRASTELAETLQKDAVRRIFHGSQDRAEIKVSPGMLEEKSVRALLRNVLELHAPAADADLNDPGYACARWHFCVHFSRSESSPWGKADKIEQILSSRHAWMGNALVPDDAGARPTLEPARLIRTLDVAGDENESKTEVFAPALRWLRSLPRPVGEKQLQLSIHAGEDYAHPLSGMRHIDETVLFCDMTKGDRIGHGLALGIKPYNWIREQGQALVSVEEHVDNLVWAWHFATTHPTLPHAAQIAALYASVVRFLARHVPWLNAPVPCAGAPDMQTLHDAWRMRRNCRNLALTPKRTELKMQVAVPDRELLLEPGTAPPHVRLFQQRLNWFDPKKRQKLLANAPEEYMVQLTYSDRNTVQLPQGHSALTLFTSVVTPFELTFMEALQDLLIEQYRKTGLVFEVNPTSNRHIGALSELKDHPIFRWDPPDHTLLDAGAEMNRFSLREGALGVCINTDDPGIMPTTLRTEFELLRHAALDRRFAPGDINAWLERLREQGNEIFNSSHQDFSVAAAPFPAL